MSYANCVVDFTLASDANHSEIINNLNQNWFDDGVVQSEVYTKKDDSLQIRLYVVLRIHDPIWNQINDKTNELSILYEGKPMLTKAYLESLAPKFI